MLDGIVPYVIAAGNHDYKDLVMERMGMVNLYFPPSGFEAYSWFGDTFEPGHIDRLAAKSARDVRSLRLLGGELRVEGGRPFDARSAAIGQTEVDAVLLGDGRRAVSHRP